MKSIFSQVKYLFIAIILGVSLGVFFGYPSVDLSKAEEYSAFTFYSVREGDTLSDVLSSFGLEDYLDDVLLASKDVYDLNTISAGNVFRFSSEGNTDDIFYYDINSEEQLVIKRGNSLNSEDSIGELSHEETFEAEKREIIYETKEVSAENTINSSLFVDAKEVGIPDKVILQLAEIFAWDVDFVADIRKGDSFKVLYEERSRDGYPAGSGNILAAKFINQGEEFLAFRYKDQYYDENGRALAKQFLKSPLNYSYISSGFTLNRVDPVTKGFNSSHRAVDYVAPSGTPVAAAADGRVASVGRDRWLGVFVELDHGGVYRTVYAHFSGVPSDITRGSRVSQGQTVGYVGSTGHSTGPHLHYEMKVHGKRVNPLTFESPPGEDLADEYIKEFMEIVSKHEGKINNG